MTPLKSSATAASTLFLLALSAGAEPKVVTARHEGDGQFKFPELPMPRRNDAATGATFSIVDGERDGNGGSLDRLHDGRLPDEGDQPGSNFFFSQRSKGGRLLVDLGKEISVAEVDSWSWHPGARGPQVYKLYGSTGSEPGFNAAPKRPADPASAGWKFLGSVDTRPKSGELGGQYGARVADSAGALGKFRYLLFDIAPTEEADPFGNTFYSEIDVVDQAGPAAEAATSIQPETLPYQTADGRFSFSINMGDAPDLKTWTVDSLAPAVQKWYPIIADLLPSEGFTPPKKFNIRFTDEYKGVAATMSTRIVCAPPWYRKNIQGEGVGSVIHELVHVVQQYGGGRGQGKQPGWLVEGIPDYVRWYLYEPQSHGTDISPNRAARVKYSDSYRVSANFLNWVSMKYDKGIVPRLNAALRQGKYDEEIWKTQTGHSLEELGEEWKTSLANPAKD